MTTRLGRALLERESSTEGLLSTLDKNFSDEHQPGRRRASVVIERISVQERISGIFPQHNEDTKIEVKPHCLKRTCLNIFRFLRNTVELISRVNFLGIFLVAVGSSALTAIVTYCVLDTKLQNILDESSIAFTCIWGFLSFALVFQTNVCYDRWWEARSAWGKIIFAIIHCGQQGKSWIADDELSSRFLIMNIVFAYACKALLRGNSLNSEEEEGPSLVLSGLIQQEELNFIHNISGWQPYYCIDVMRGITNEAWSHQKDGCILKNPSITGPAYISMENVLKNLATSIEPCIKVKATGLPISYNRFMRTVIIISLAGASLSWSSTLKWGTPIVVCIVFFVTDISIAFSKSLLEPFGGNYSSLPLQKYCVCVEQQLTALERRQTTASCLVRGDYANLALDATPSNHWEESKSDRRTRTDRRIKINSWTVQKDND